MANSGPHNPAFLFALGVALGTGVGVVLREIAIGAAIGAGMGGVAAVVFGRR